jgi:hypothetical protein
LQAILSEAGAPTDSAIALETYESSRVETRK